ncbi:hypothetical protein Q8A67_000011 [Cirrhinus molitorella]|uniref:Uncharacterized protein n=1 Tax=Cirrhinus molitorella TaxID=172907 RepID=A0AA88TWG9_9TELE|nr:hypothetical protein Q8A67_000011 [Cirrhinus molitorella]
MFPNDKSPEAAVSSPATTQATTTPQDPPSEPAAATRGRRPSRAAAHPPRRRPTPSRSPSKRQLPSPASSYASAISSVPATGKLTVAGLRQALTNAGVVYPRRATKAERPDLFISLQSGEPLFFTPPPKAAVRAASGRSAPYSRPGQTTTASRTGSRSSCPAKRPSASLGRALDTEAASPPPPPCSSEHQLAGDVHDRQAVASPSHHISTSTPSAAKNHPQLIPHLTPNPLPYPWPAAPPSHPSASMPPLMAQAPAPQFPLLLEHLPYPPPPQQNPLPLPLEPLPFLPTITAVPTPAGAFSMFSNPKPSELNIDPPLTCQTCINIVDSDQWVQIEALAYTEEGISMFRFSTVPGRYKCIRTRMRWVCDCEVTFQYHVIDGQFLNTQLEHLQYNRIGPVIDVTVISGKLDEVHLPHYLCLGNSDPSLKDDVKVLSVKDEGIYVEPVQLTRFHAKIVQPSFSLKTLIINWIMQWDEHCNLLLYMCFKDPLILHVYFFPLDEHLKEVVEKEEKSSYPIKHPRPDKAFRMKTPHFLKVPGASVHPKEGITLRRDTVPNFFKVKKQLENDLEMTLTRDEVHGRDCNIVWTATIEKDELDQINPKKDEQHLHLNSDTDKAAFYDNNFADLIRRVINVKIVADQLLQQDIIHKEQYSQITHDSLTSADSMRKICDIMRKCSVTVKAKLITILQDEKLYDFRTSV